MRCTFCKRTAEEVELYEGILDGSMAMVCSECAEKEEVPLIRKPSQDQLKKAEKRYSVRERMERLSGHRETTEISPDQSVVQRNLSKLRMPEKKEKHGDVVDDYYWKLNMARRRKKLTLNQLSEKIGIEAEIIESIEKGRIPEDFEEIFYKLENFFGIKLLKAHSQKINFIRNKDNEEEILREVRKKMDEKAIEHSGELTNKNEKLERIRHGEFDFSKREELQNVTLNDLVEMKRAREKKEAGLKKREKIDSLVGDDIDLDAELDYI